MKQLCTLGTFLTEYKEKNKENKYKPVAVGRYGIRKRESIYSKELAKDYSKNKLIFKNTLTVGMGSTQIDIGILTDDIICSVSPAYHTYRVNGINATYLRYCLECRNQDMFVRFVKRGSRQGKTIDLKRWLKYEIPVWNAEMQIEIANKLDYISNLIIARNEQIALFDELVKSRFIELFGDPILNDRKLPTLSGENFFKLSNGKAVPEEKRLEAGVPAYGGNGISWYTNEFLMAEDTIVVGRVGFQSGNVHYAAGPLWITDNAMYISQYDKNKFNLIFLCELMQHVNFSRFQDAGDLKKITQKPFMSFEYVLPSMELQQQFVDFKAQVDKSKHFSEWEVAA